MVELLTMFNVYCYLPKFSLWKLFIIKLCETKNMLHIINELLKTMMKCKYQNDSNLNLKCML